MKRSLLVAGLLALALPVSAPAQLRDPAQPYGSWGEAARETEAAIAGRTLARPAGGVYAVGDAVVFSDDGKRYRAHVVGIENGRYVVHYDGFGPDWQRRADADALLGFQPGFTRTAAAAAPSRAPRVGDEVQAREGGRWRDARVVGVRGAELRVHFDGRPASDDAWLAAGEVRPFAGGLVQTAPLAAGRYPCTASRYDTRAGRWVFDAKGTVVLLADGRYQYLGFAQPSPGRFRADPATRALAFTGGHLAGGVATPMVQRPGRFYLTAPRIGERWICGAARS